MGDKVLITTTQKRLSCRQHETLVWCFPEEAIIVAKLCLVSFQRSGPIKQRTSSNLQAFSVHKATATQATRRLVHFTPTLHLRLQKGRDLTEGSLIHREVFGALTSPRDWTAQHLVVVVNEIVIKFVLL